MSIGFKRIENIPKAKEIVNHIMVSETGELYNIWDPKRPINLGITGVEDVEVGITDLLIKKNDNTIEYLNNFKIDSTINYKLRVKNFKVWEYPSSNFCVANWEEPDDERWRYTIIVRKLNSMPTSISDGEIAIVNTVKNAYSQVQFWDDVVFPQTTDKYYYRAFIVLQTFEADNSDLDENKAELIFDVGETIEGYEFDIEVPESLFNDVNIEIIPQDEVINSDYIIEAYSFDIEKTSDKYLEDIEITFVRD